MNQVQSETKKKLIFPIQGVSSEMNQIATIAILLKDLLKQLPKEDRSKLKEAGFKGRNWMIHVMGLLIGGVIKVSDLSIPSKDGK